MIHTDYIVCRRKIYSSKVKNCIETVHIHGTTEKGDKVSFYQPCNSHYCNLCGLKICRKKAKEQKVKHANRPHHHHIVLKFGDFQDLTQQQKCYEAMKTAFQYQDQSAIFSKVNQWLKGRRHFHFVMSSDEKWSKTKIKAIRDKYFNKYNIPITTMSTMGYRYAANGDTFLDYMWRTGVKKDKPRWKKTEYPPIPEVWSLIRS